MGAKTTLNANNLTALGVQRLAELLIEISTGSAAHKRRLRMELAGSTVAPRSSEKSEKRLSSIARAKTFIDWREVEHEDGSGISAEDHLRYHPSHDTAGAFKLIWQFLAIPDPLFGRSDDGSGSFFQTFHQAGTDAGSIAKAAKIDADVLAEKIFKAFPYNTY
jgi:hypothetical protein